MTGIYTRTLLEGMEDRAPRITGLYRSPEFCEQARRLADVQEHYFRTCIDRLVDSGIVPHADPDPLVAVAMDMATLLAALSTRSDSAVMLADTQRTLSMPFRFEFGASAMYGPWNHPDGIDETCVQTFGAHLARSIRQRFDARAPSEADLAAVLTVGRGPPDRAEIFGTIKSFQSTDATSLYSTCPVFDRRHDGIVRIEGLELDLIRPISLTSIESDAFAELMRADRQKHFPISAAHRTI